MEPAPGNTAAPESNSLDRLAEHVGESVVSLFSLVGSVLSFVVSMTINLPNFFKNSALSFEQMAKIGISSMPVVLLTAGFTGAVTAWQAAYQFSDYIPLTYMGVAVGKSTPIM